MCARLYRGCINHGNLAYRRIFHRAGKRSKKLKVRFESTLNNAALDTKIGYVLVANIGESNVKESMMAKRTEYLVIKYARDGSILNATARSQRRQPASFA